MMRGYSAIGLWNPKTNENVGSVLRSAQAFGVGLVLVKGRRYKRAITDTTSAWKHVPLIHVDNMRDSIPYDCVPVAVELSDGAIPITRYTHPERALYIFGPEDSSLGGVARSWCRDTIYLPTIHCLNLAACVAAVLCDRAVKRDEFPATEPISMGRRAA